MRSGPVHAASRHEVTLVLVAAALITLGVVSSMAARAPDDARPQAGRAAIPAASGPGAIVIKGGTLIDGTGSAARPVGAVDRKSVV